METFAAIECLQSLAHETRLEVFRLLVRAGHNGLTAGDISAALSVPPPTLTFHLKILSAAGVVERKRDGRQQWYSVRFDQLKGLMDFLLEDCCQGNVTPGYCPPEQGGCCMPEVTKKPKVLFLCTGNSCRSQMAEGWARALRGDVLEAYSAGTSPHGMNPLAVQVMAEAGVDISHHTSKTPDQIPGVTFDHVVTVCGHAHETCPVFSGGAKITHAGFEDPPALCREMTNDEEKLPVYRRVRDEIREYILTLPQALED